MRHFKDQWIENWCSDNGWTDLYVERCNNYWAFPPGAVIPEPIPPKTLRIIKLKEGLCDEEKLWLGLATGLTLFFLVLGYISQCPIPLVFAFAFDAVTAARLEVEYI
jgi:hypothetical protein